jgi:magnesium transporter
MAGPSLAAHYTATFPDEVARHVERLDRDAAVEVMSSLPAETAAALLPLLAPGRAARLVQDLNETDAVAVIRSVRADVAASLMRRMEPTSARQLLAGLDAHEAHDISRLLAHDPATAGGVMDPRVLTVTMGATVADARLLVAADPEHLYYYMYVVDAAHRLVGVFDLAELMQASAHDLVESIAEPSVTWLSPDTPLVSVYEHPGWRTLDAMPVIDHDRRFLGVLRHRRVRQLQAEEAPSRADDHAVQAVLALGEVYWLGLCGLLQGIAATATDADSSGGPA